MSAPRWAVPSVPARNDDPLAHAMALVAFPAFLGGIGALVDSAAGTGPVLLLVLAAVGVVASFASAFYRYERRIERVEAGKPWTRRAGAPGATDGRAVSP